jgi:hypothetical protein
MMRRMSALRHKAPRTCIGTTDNPFGMALRTMGTLPSGTPPQVTLGWAYLSVCHCGQVLQMDRSSTCDLSRSDHSRQIL